MHTANFGEVIVEEVGVGYSGRLVKVKLGYYGCNNSLFVSVVKPSAARQEKNKSSIAYCKKLEYILTVVHRSEGC